MRGPGRSGAHRVLPHEAVAATLKSVRSALIAQSTGAYYAPSSLVWNVTPGTSGGSLTHRGFHIVQEPYGSGRCLRRHVASVGPDRVRRTAAAGTSRRVIRARSASSARSRCRRSSSTRPRCSGSPRSTTTPARSSRRAIRSRWTTSSRRCKDVGLQAAGHAVQLSDLDRDAGRPVLNMVSPTPKTYKPGTAADSDPPTVDFITMANSPHGRADQRARCSRSAGSSTRPPAARRSGCTADDYTGVNGKVALVQRGTCAVRREVAVRAGRGRHRRDHLQRGQHARAPDPIFVDNQPDPPATIAAVISSYTLGNDLLQAYKAGQEPDRRLQGLRQVHRPLPAAGDRRDQGRRPEQRRRRRRAPGLRARGPGHQRRRLRHGDAARAGPGARLRPLPPRQKIRFAWWGAEENGLVGSSYYARNLSDKEVGEDRRDARLRHARARPTTSSASTTATATTREEGVEHPAGPEGSGKVEDVFDDWFHAQGRPTVKGAFDGRSDYVGFTDRGIPSGGIYAGAEGVKTAAAGAVVYGGAAGSWYDPCYHQICDNLIDGPDRRPAAHRRRPRA